VQKVCKFFLIKYKRFLNTWNRLIEGGYYYKEHKISQSYEMQKLDLTESDVQ